MKRNHYERSLVSLLLIIAVGAVIALGVAGCKTEADDPPAKPTALADDASYDDAVAKLDEIIAYCGDNTTYAGAKVTAETLKGVLETTGEDGYDAATVVPSINSIVDAIAAL